MLELAEGALLGVFQGMKWQCILVLKTVLLNRGDCMEQATTISVRLKSCKGFVNRTRCNTARVV